MRRISHVAWKATERIAIRRRDDIWRTSGHSRAYHDAYNIKPVTKLDGTLGVDKFRSLAWEPAVPTILHGINQLPARDKWFTSDLHSGQVSFNHHRLRPFESTVVSYELATSSAKGGKDSGSPSSDLEEFRQWLEDLAQEDSGRILCDFVDHLLESIRTEATGFLRFDAPLGLIIRASQFNESRRGRSDRLKQLYIAQSDIRSLPESLAGDLPVPEIVLKAGRGDVYSSSIWLGLQPTYTPLHRDPNPNLFCQLVGSKTVRLLRPRDGQSIFQDVRRSLGSGGNSRFRGPEMMYGPERDKLHRAVWTEAQTSSKDIWEVMVNPGDALFIPQGWWHSVVSTGQEAELNASANWWFR
ncbi:hypothetical protein F5Y17DRAFT_425949 [Xylariaceae sp. FL0594]|nr:hypothetical protein F5Y17DRAFT_425949 [Xylariaceae sp. FL0594]